MPDFRSQALALANSYRAAGAMCGAQGSFPPVAALAWNDALTQASLVHSDDMMSINFFSHTGSNGSSAGQRATAAGYAWRTWGENIAAGQPTVANVMAGWLASPGHCANLMNADFRDIGLACVSGGAGNTYRTYWTMTLGAR
ncbi:MAG: CAP domain-containing protein [Rubrivivax sp.]|nr:CAP domain-containing protein [Rubrivivax sp.]